MNRAESWLALAPGGKPLEIAQIEQFQISLPMKSEFASAHGKQGFKSAIVIKLTSSLGNTGWGECSALQDPTYSAEWTDGAWQIIERYLAPALLDQQVFYRPDDLNLAMATIYGHPMAKAALQAAALDAWLRQAGENLSQWLQPLRRSPSRVPCAVSIGMAPSLKVLTSEVEHHLQFGYKRVKIKISPGSDLAELKAIIKSFPEIVLGADANGSYDPCEPAHLRSLRELDELGLVMIEQPFAAEQFTAHAELQSELTTPLCLDESLRNVADIYTAVSLGSGRIINIKPARMGGLLQAVSAQGAASRLGLKAWIGGMYETGIGRAVSLALASLDGINMAGDIGPSSRYFVADITEPYEMSEDGTMEVPTGLGIGVDPDKSTLDAVAIRSAISGA